MRRSTGGPYASLQRADPTAGRGCRGWGVDPGEREDLTWLCERRPSTEFFDMLTADLQRLHALVAVSPQTARSLLPKCAASQKWHAEHEHLKTCWPYDEIEALTTKVLGDGWVDEAEHKTLLHFFTEFIAVLDERTVVRPIVFEGPERKTGALCAVSPASPFGARPFALRAPHRSTRDRTSSSRCVSSEASQPLPSPRSSLPRDPCRRQSLAGRSPATGGKWKRS
jgi:hypothetical protein